MGEVTFTKEQRNVIDARDCTLLVAAAAGSGKTAVLVQRVIEKMLDREKPQDISRLLVVTFTNAAAAQMRERIAKKISEVIPAAQAEQSLYLQKQAILLRNAPIMTIHSFCLSILREYFYELGLDPSFRVAEEAEKVLLEADVMEKLLEEEYAAPEGDDKACFLRLTEVFGSGKNDDGLVEAIQTVNRFVEAAPFPESWIAKQQEKLLKLCENPEFSKDDVCLYEVVKTVRETALSCLDECHRAMEICKRADGPFHYLDALQDDESFFENLAAAGDYAAIVQVLNEHEKFSTLSSKRPKVDEELKKRAKEIRDGYKETIEKLKAAFFFADTKQMAEDMSAMAPLLLKLLKLCLKYRTLFSEAKAERALVDFSDLEHYAVRLLVEETEDGYMPTSIAKVLKERFDEIMTDECQDSNLIQDLLLWSISKENEGTPNRFMVGDVKQSIYKFRMAKPELFMEKYATYAEDGKYRKIVLGKNFRSRQAVVDFVNSVFGCLMREEFGGIAYDDAAKLYCGADYAPDTPQNKTELLLTETGTDKEEETENVEKITMEALTIGAEIQRMVREGFLVSDGSEIGEDGVSKKKFRRASYGDFLVLMRSPNGMAEHYSEAFAELGIPVLVQSQTGYFSAQEVAVSLSALRILDNPRQDIPLVTVLHSEMAGLSGEELSLVLVTARASLGKNKITYFEAVECFNHMEPKAVHEYFEKADEGVHKALESAHKKVKAFCEIYWSLREKSHRVGVAELLNDLWERTGYLDSVMVKPGGERRMDNLRMLSAKARAFENTSYSGVFDFVRYIDRLVKYNTDSAQAQNTSQNDAVQIMSIHKSKGLEAPIVIVAGLSKKMNLKDTQKELVLDEELGIAMQFRDERMRVKAPTLLQKVIARRMKDDMLAEELRILYVAFTRAKEKLILSASVKGEKDFWEDVEKTDCHGEKVPVMRLASATDYLNFLLPTIAQCKENGTLEVLRSYQNRQQTEEAVSNQQTEREMRRQKWEQITEMTVNQTFSEELEQELHQRETFRYPYPLLSGKKKLSVSELKKAAYEQEMQEEMFAEQNKVPAVPKFMQTGEETKELTGSERGTLVHRIMECMDFTKEYKTKEDIWEETKRLIEEGKIPKKAQKAIAADRLLGFFTSPLGNRMREAAKKGFLSKEKPFVIYLPYEEVYHEGEGSGEYVMVQGIIDACFEENGKLILVDYKTDHVAQNVQQVLTQRYRTQLEYYAHALGQITGKSVEERIIYAFANGEFFDV